MYIPSDWTLERCVVYCEPFGFDFIDCWLMFRDELLMRLLLVGFTDDDEVAIICWA